MVMAHRSFKYIDHPSDIGIEVEGKSLEELFLNAATAMLSVIRERKDGDKDETYLEKHIHLEEECTEELLHSFLTEILWLVMQEGFFPLTICIITMHEEQIDAELSGVSIEKREMKTEIKAITYHQLCVEKRDDKLFTRIIFDV
jgi:SHS2 domain-containing protein